MQLTLTTENFFDGYVLHGPTSVTVEADRVVDIRPYSGDCEHHLVSPGLIDLQMNGWEHIDVADTDVEQLRTLDEQLWQQGTAHWLGTIVTAPANTMARRLDNLDQIHRSDSIPGFRGVHVEGPFLGHAPGAHDTRHVIDADPQIVQALPSCVRIVTLAPEAIGAVEATEALAAKGVVVSAGHSRPSHQEFNRLVNGGASMVTHLFNGMSGIHHREGGLALWALLDDRVTLGLITDGHHVGADAVQLAFRTASRRLCLVSDSVAWSSARSLSRGVTQADGVAALPDGTLAGSCTSLAGCLRWAVLEAKVPLVEALTAATRIPSTLIGADDLGTIREGEESDLIWFDSALHVTGGHRRLASQRD